MQIDKRSFIQAAEEGDLQTIRRCLEAGVDPNWRSTCATPLHAAALYGRLQVVEELLQHGADPNSGFGWEGRTPLHLAAGRGCTGLCRILIEKGAEVDARDMYMNTPLHHAAENGHPATCRALVQQHHADVNAINQVGDTPLHLVARKGHQELCGALIEKGAVINAKDKDGNTPIHSACREKKVDIVDLLIEKGADVLICNKQETTKQTYNELVRSLGTAEEKTVKVFLSGFGQVGKTCLGTALEKGSSFDPTPGVNISSRVVRGIGRIGVFDFAGQTEFYVTHAMLLRTTNSIFPLVYNIDDKVHTWLSLIKCSNPDDTRKPRVILIASHADMLKTTEEKEHGKLRAEEMVKHHRELFKAFLVISEEVFLMDCRDATSPEMRRFRQVLAAIKEDMLRERKPVPKICADLKSQLASWIEKKGKFPVMKWEEYLSAVKKGISDSLTERVVQLATSYLHDVGEAIYLRGNNPMVILDSQWLCTSVFGPLMAPVKFPIVKINPTKDDLVTRKEIKRVFGKVADIPMLIQLLQAFQLCHPYDEERFIFPTRLQKEMPTDEWAKTNATETIYFGCQVRCRDVTDEFSCDFFPRVQTQLLKHQKDLITKPIIWKNSIKCVDAHADALVQYTIDKKTVNIIVRSGSGQREHCRPMMRMIKNIVYTTLKETSPGTKSVEEVLSAYALKEHKGYYAYSTEQIEDAPNHDGVVLHKEVQEREHLQNLLIDMDDETGPDTAESTLEPRAAGLEPVADDVREGKQHLKGTQSSLRHDAYEDNHNRLASRVSRLGLTFRAEVPGDGNCMFHAVSDQVLRTEGRDIGHLQLREQAVRGDHLSKFISNHSWEEYLETMSLDGTWGDHVVLQAMADMLGHDVTIVSSVEADNYVTFLYPQLGPPHRDVRPLLLGHYAENHYVSLDGPRVPIILLLNDEYGTSNGGISTINCEAGQTMKGKAVVYCTVLRVPEQDQEAADRDGVQLIRPDPRGRKTEPTLDWLTDYRDHFPNLPKDVTCIIGHADITDTAARNIRDERYPQADLMMFTHVIREDTEYYKGGRKAMKAGKKEKDMLDNVDNAKAAFSVGKRIHEHFSTKYKGDKKPQSHHIFLPKPSEMFLATTVRPGGGQKVVLSIGRVRNVEKLKGHDLAGQSMRDVVKIIKNVRLRVRGISEDDWENSLKILEDALNSPDLNPTLLPYGTQKDVRDDMMTAHLVLMPSRSEPFGLVGLEAIAAGIPVLISDKSGLADMILDLIKEGKLSPEHSNVIVETSVNDRDRAGDAKRWADRIVDILKNSDSEFEKAARFKRELVESRYWEESHRTLLQACGIPAAAADP
ncbi:hypothetical protein Bbelb_328910 [Branchiostoma belcheri]|nr:hypothetical protein Bbelb_328910 [Branchiostoma belcheri]